MAGLIVPPQKPEDGNKAATPTDTTKQTSYPQSQQRKVSIMPNLSDQLLASKGSSADIAPSLEEALNSVPLNQNDLDFIERYITFLKTRFQFDAEPIALIRSELERNPRWSFDSDDEFAQYVSDLAQEAVYRAICSHYPNLTFEECLKARGNPGFKIRVFGRTPPKSKLYQRVALDCIVQIAEQVETQEERQQSREMLERILADVAFAQQFVEEMRKAQQSTQQAPQAPPQQSQYPNVSADLLHTAITEATTSSAQSKQPATTRKETDMASQQDQQDIEDEIRSLQNFLLEGVDNAPEIIALVRSEMARNPRRSFRSNAEYEDYKADLAAEAFFFMTYKKFMPDMTFAEYLVDPEMKKIPNPGVIGRTPPQQAKQQASQPSPQQGTIMARGDVLPPRQQPSQPPQQQEKKKHWWQH